MSYILGIDEAGRGAWAGPLTVGAVVLGDSAQGKLTDSKLLTKLMRSQIAGLIYKNAIFAKVGWVSAEEIDRIGLTQATTLGIERALAGAKYDEYEMIIDGHINYFKSYKNSRCLIKADGSIPAVSAASIIAKVARDEYMAEMSIEHPGYGFERHVGYGTKVHQTALNDMGITKLHRLSYKPVSVYGAA
ncbi:MAG TPA: ribonuclease HII [Patescibacteria group bacterium]|nr:ribonuclease HII [Patescibacteria group bacterium]